MFAPLSLLSFGGSNAVIADIAQQSIAVQGWTSEREFADLFALSRAAPGPGSMLAALIGWKVAGLAGAARRDDRCLRALRGAGLRRGARLWGRWRGSAWHAAVERGLAPVAAGLFLSGGIAVLRPSPGGAPIWLGAAGRRRSLLLWPRLHPVPVMFAGGVCLRGGGDAGALTC